MIMRKVAPDEILRSSNHSLKHVTIISNYGIWLAPVTEFHSHETKILPNYWKSYIIASILYAHPCEKVMGLFFQNQISARSHISVDCVSYVSNDPLMKLNSVRYQSIVISRVEWWLIRIARCQFRDINWVTKLRKRWVYLTTQFYPNYLSFSK